MRETDDYSIGVSLCCTGSVIMVAIVFVGIMDYADNLVPMIAFSLFLHVAGLLLILVGVVLAKLRAPPKRYYDWGL